MVVNIEVEYCGTCGYAAKFEEMKQVLQKQSDVNLVGREGRRASFEVKVNDIFVHSKLATMAFPDFEDVSKIAAEVAIGHDVRRNCKQQPITNCVVM